jgi:hypothetical protein
MNDDLRKSEDERAPEQKMISKHRSTNWVRTRDKCGIAVLGMKKLGGSGEMVRHRGITANKVLRYAMSLSVAITICGMDSMEVLHQNLAVAVTFQPYFAAE